MTRLEFDRSEMCDVEVGVACGGLLNCELPPAHAGAHRVEYEDNLGALHYGELSWEILKCDSDNEHETAKEISARLRRDGDVLPRPLTKNWPTSDRRRGVALRSLEILAATGNKLTRGEIRTALQLPPDVAIDSRLRELRKVSYGAFDLKIEHADGEYRYYLPESERERALILLTERAK